MIERFKLGLRNLLLIGSVFGITSGDPLWTSQVAFAGGTTELEYRPPGSHQIVNHPLSQRDIHAFLKLKATTLPLYANLFRKHSYKFGIPWQLTAAVSYQESHWNPQAQSYTGVRGLMQLTEQTAERVGVENRRDTEQSVWGGAKYLKMLLDRQPSNIPFRERLALALATYNIGPSHMVDAQRLAVSQNKNPYRWSDLQTVLPLLSQKKYLSLLKHGPARGSEPVLFVHRVLAYLDLFTVQI